MFSGEEFPGAADFEKEAKVGEWIEEAK